MCSVYECFVILTFPALLFLEPHVVEATSRASIWVTTNLCFIGTSCHPVSAATPLIITFTLVHTAIWLSTQSAASLCYRLHLKCLCILVYLDFFSLFRFLGIPAVNWYSHLPPHPVCCRLSCFSTSAWMPYTQGPILRGWRRIPA